MIWLISYNILCCKLKISKIYRYISKICHFSFWWRSCVGWRWWLQANLWGARTAPSSWWTTELDLIGSSFSPTSSDMGLSVDSKSAWKTSWKMSLGLVSHISMIIGVKVHFLQLVQLITHELKYTFTCKHQ